MNIHADRTAKPGVRRRGRRRPLPRRSLCAALVATSIATAVSATDAHPPYRFDPRVDGPLTLAGLGLAVGGFLWSESTAPISTTELATLSVSDIPALDGGGVFELSPSLDTASTVASYGMVALAPIGLALARWDQAFAIGAMYVQALAVALGTKDLLKALVRRPRPFLYGSPSAEQLAAGDSLNSFPSGHTTLVFTSAAFASTVVADLYPDAPVRHLVAAGSFVAAGAAASLRVLAGAHFLTDVIAGAALGSLIGWLVPVVHRPPRAAAAGAAAGAADTPDAAAIGVRVNGPRLVVSVSL